MTIDCAILMVHPVINDCLPYRSVRHYYQSGSEFLTVDLELRFFAFPVSLNKLIAVPEMMLPYDLQKGEENS